MMTPPPLRWPRTSVRTRSATRALAAVLLLVLTGACRTPVTPVPANDPPVPPPVDLTPAAESGATDRPWTTLPDHEPALPGVEAPSSHLGEILDVCTAAQGEAYVPRTEHLDAEGAPRFTNRLACESSPYLLQHTHNPVNWYPWGDEAFARARERGVPVLLSVGYSTCHWCHVMERESFESEQVAELINRRFVAIKVDREERPDIDEIYMTAVNVLTGRGGWPMTVVLTPDRQPFFAGTYFPARARGNRAGLFQILTDLADTYAREPEAVVADARQLTARIAGALDRDMAGALPGPAALEGTAHGFAAAFDPTDGGFGNAPKFPRPAVLHFLLRYARRTGDEGALTLVTRTLEEMAAGGMYDQVGGGFHRYSTDREWLVPHFEKMLYDNAQLAVIYTEAWQATGRDDFQRVARDVLEYLVREMRHPDGGFFSATDADSLRPDGESEEGYYFTWTEAEIDAELGDERGTLMREFWGTSPAGNFEGRNILHTPVPFEEFAARSSDSAASFGETCSTSRRRLRVVRDRRAPPLLDDKILAAWNGLTISALSRAGLAWNNASYRQAAREAARFVLAEMRLADGRLLRSWRNGQARQPAFLDDHAFVIAGLLDLFEADGDVEWLREAIALQAQQDDLFADADRGGYFTTPADGEPLLARTRPDYDGAEPSGNSVAILNLLRLAELTLDDTYREGAEQALAAFAGTLQRRGRSAPLMLAALDLHLDTARQIVVVVPEGDSGVEDLLAERRRRFLPHTVTAVVAVDAVEGAATTVPIVEHKVAREGRATAYVCERGRCEAPTSDPAVFATQLELVEPLFDDDTARRPIRIPSPRR